MIAKNHEAIFEAVHADLIAALERAGLSDGAHPYALYVGNWMADFTQLYSPDLPNMLLDLLDLPDTVRRLVADAGAFLDAQQEALPAAIAAAVTKMGMDKGALARAAAKVRASPYRNEVLDAYADYLRAAPSPLATPVPEPASKPLPLETKNSEFLQRKVKASQDTKKLETALTTLQKIARHAAQAQGAQSGGKAEPNAAALVQTLVVYMLGPLFEDLRNLLKAVDRAADVGDELYRKMIETLTTLGFVDKWNDAAKLAIWLLGLFKFSNPANADPRTAPGAGSGPGAASSSALPRAVPSFLLAPQSFVAPPSTAGAMRAADHIPPNIYSALFATHFGYYKPYEHLDRFMDPKLVADATGGGAGPRTLDQKRKFRADRKENYAKIVTEIVSLKEAGIDLDATLWSGLEIAYGRLLDLRGERGQKLPINDRLLLLGRSFHAFEDYFAHTNFVDRLVYSMQLEHGFHTHSFELKKILLSVASERAFNEIKAKNLFADVDCANKQVRQIIEAGATECVKSGFYDTPDTIHSLVHLLEGRIKQALDMEDEERDARFDLYDALEGYALRKLEAIEKAGPEAWQDGKTDLGALLAADPGDIFLDEESFAKIANSNLLVKSMGTNADLLRKLINAIFWLILAFYAAKHAKDGYKAVSSALTFFITVMRIVKAIFLTPNVLLRYLRIAFATLPDWLRDELIALAVEAFKEVVRTLASIVLGWIDKMLENNVRYGSHSLMAKDESTHQGRLYALAEKFGILIDKAALEFVFPEPPKKPADPNAPPPPAPPPRDVLECLLDGFAYNPLTLEREALTCVSRGLLTRYTLQEPSSTLDLFLKGSVNAHLVEDQMFVGVPGFGVPLMEAMGMARRAKAMRTLVMLNADRITLIAGKDPLFLSDATFKLLKPAHQVDLIVWKPGQTSALKAPPPTITVKPWTVSFVDAFMSGKPIKWEDYDLATLTAGSPSGKRRLPEDYRILAGQFIGGYSQIWRNILVIPGTIGDAEWAVPHEGPAAGWL